MAGMGVAVVVVEAAGIRLGMVVGRCCRSCKTGFVGSIRQVAAPY